MSDPDYANLAGAVTAARLALPGAPTQAEFARQVGVSTTTLGLVENGKSVGTRSVAKIAKGLGWPAEMAQRLLDGEAYTLNEPPPVSADVARAELLTAVRELTEMVRELRAELREGRR